MLAELKLLEWLSEASCWWHEAPLLQRFTRSQLQTDLDAITKLMRDQFLSVSLIKQLIQMSSGTFQKRKQFICAGAAVLVWRASRQNSYHEKNLEGFST